jgi:PPOX class probable F420-dependent enzyme
MDSGEVWALLGRTPYVSLTTYRKTGVAVSTPVWIAADGPDLVVTTDRGTGKAKRIRNNGRVTMQPCGRLGKVKPDAVRLDATARIDADPAQGTAALAAKYGIQFRIFLGVEHAIAWLRRKPGDRVILRIRPLSD